MKEYLFSPGTAIVATIGADRRSFRNVEARVDVDPRELQHLLPLITDWVQLKGEVDEDKLAALAHLERAYRYIVDVLSDLRDDGLTLEVFDALEALLRADVPELALVRRVAVGAFAPSVPLQGLLKLAINHPSLRAALRALERAQPVLLELEQHWSRAGGDADKFWARLVDESAVYDLALAGTRTAFEGVAFGFLKKLARPDERLIFQQLIRQIGESRFGTAKIPEPLRQSDDEPDLLPERQRRGEGQQRKERALKQVASIEEALRRGDVSEATKFFRELMSEQASTPEHAIKSVCNVAKKAADLYHEGFESQCLRDGVSIAPMDPWFNIQKADHQKRRGEYDAAIRSVEVASGAEPTVAAKLKADIMREQGRFEEAVSIYKSQLGWETDEVSRTALADILRVTGDMEGAKREYRAVLRDWPASPRAFLGISLIDRKGGRLDDALKRLVRVCDEWDGLMDSRTRDLVYLNRARLELLAGHYSAARDTLGALRQRSPFMPEARAAEVSLGALTGRFAANQVEISPADAWRVAAVRALAGASVVLNDTQVQPADDTGKTVILLVRAHLTLIQGGQVSLPEPPSADAVLGAAAWALCLRTTRSSDIRRKGLAQLRNYAKRSPGSSRLLVQLADHLEAGTADIDAERELLIRATAA